MSVRALIAWAFEQPLDRSSTKFVLVALASCANGESGVAFPSIVHLSEMTGQNRKTVIAGLAALVAEGFIADTGQRVGSTKQVVAYRLCRDRKSAENGTLKQSQKRNGTENGTVPKTDGNKPENGPLTPPSSTENGTVTPPKQSQKRDTEQEQEQQQKQEQKQKQARSAPVVLPEPPAEWNAAEAWAGFVDMRKRAKHPLTERAAELVIAELEKLRAERAHKPADVLDQSTRNNWRDVYPLKSQQNTGAPQHGTTRRLTPAERVLANIARRHDPDAGQLFDERPDDTIDAEFTVAG